MQHLVAVRMALGPGDYDKQSEKNYKGAPECIWLENRRNVEEGRREF